MKLESIFCATAMMVAPVFAGDVVPVYDLEGMITESGQSGGGLMDFANSNRPMTHFDLVRSLKKAVADPDVKAVVIDADGAGMGMAQLQDVRRQMLALKAAEKPVWLYTENLSNGIAILSSAAEKVVLMPEGGVDFNGLYSESYYFKGLLDKVGVQADVVHIGDFKSFGETFYRTGPSDPALLQSKVLLDDIYGQLIDQVSEGRNIAKDEVKELVDQAWMTPDQAKEKGMVDELMYRTDLVDKLEELYADAEFDRSYGMEALTGPEIDGFFDLVKVIFGSANSESNSKSYVAVVTLDGGISDESIAPVRAEILKIIEDDNAKALVLRVNSPGGSAMASEVLWEATDEWKQTGKPFVVSMGNVAASGGYYVAAGADEIFAEPGTITGSIGVVGMKLVVTDALEKVGITVHSEQRGEHAGMMTMTRPFSDDEEALMRASMEDVYKTFKQRITDGRGDKLAKPIEELGGGRVYSGALALQHGLVDQLGGLNEAVAAAAKSANLEAGDFNVILRPRSLSPFEELFREEESSGEMIKMTRGAQPLAAALEQSMMKASLLEVASPAQRQAISDFLDQVRALQSDRIQLIGNVPTINF